MIGLLAGVLGLAAAAGLYVGLNRWGGAELRGWAAPGAAAVAAGSLGHALNLPSWVTVGVFLGALFLFHKKARERLAAEAAAVGAVRAEGTGWLLEPMPTPPGATVGGWSCRDGSDPEPVVFTLEYEGQKEEDFKTILFSRSKRFRPGLLVAHRAKAEGDAAKIMAEREEIGGLPGQDDAVTLRATPPDYAFALLDFKTLNAVQELLQASRAGREVYLHLNGPELRVVCEGMPGREDIAFLLAKAAVLSQRLRFIAGR
ncbi:MAG: hypothetical protein HYZ75_16335 [Elusimicrobia bacterium]|nr:hypothetical protein [Elusimicrobiota bacterium]